MENIWQKFTRFSSYAFILSMILYAILFFANTFTDFVVSDRYLNNNLVLVLTLMFGFISIFQKSKINEQ